MTLKERNEKKLETNIIINKVAKYVPKKEVTNDELIEHFDREGKDCRGILKAFQRNTRYFADSSESSLTMGICAAEKALEGVDRDSIDMVIFVSATPEYTSPSNALFIICELGLKNAHRQFDMNANCTGFLDAMYIAKNIMKEDNEVNKVLIVGTEMFSTIVNYHDIPAYTQFADGACAMILDKIMEEKQRGILDYQMCNDTRDIKNITYPAIGMSNVLMTKPKNREKRLEWIPFNADYFPEIWKKLISKVLNRNSVKENDIAGWCMSQLFPRENEQIIPELGYSLKKYKFVGDKYGYTGNCSPIFALEESDFLKQKDKYIIFNSVAAGCHFVTLLYKN